MFNPQLTDLTDYLATLDLGATIALIAGAVAAFALADALARRLTAGTVARARARAEQWSAHRAAELRRRARTRARARAVARSFMDTPAARRAMLAALAVTAASATVLSAHGVQDSLIGAGITAWWARLAGLLAFEGFLLVMGSLSWWHRTTGQDGPDVYGALVWAGAGVLALVGYHGGGDWLYAVFAPMAALGFHLLTGAERRRRGAGTTWAARLSAAVRSRAEHIAVMLGRTPTSADTTARERERRRSRLIARAVRAHRASRAKGWRVRLFERALADAEARGLLDAEGRALIAERCAARYTALAALAPEVLAAGPGLWNRAVEAATPALAPVAVAAPAIAPAIAPATPTAPVAAPEPVPAPAMPAAAQAPAAGPVDVRTAVMAAFGPMVPRQAAAWCADYVAEHGTLPTGRVLGDAVGTSHGNARKWLAPVRGVVDAV